MINRFKKRWWNTPIWPALLSGLVAPGLGQIQNGEVAKGLFLFGSAIGSFLWFSKSMTERLMVLMPYPPDQWVRHQEEMKQALMSLMQQTPGMVLTFQVLMVLIWIFSIVDAYVTAKNRRKGTLPFNESDNTDR